MISGPTRQARVVLVYVIFSHGGVVVGPSRRTDVGVEPRRWLDPATWGSPVVTGDCVARATDV